MFDIFAVHVFISFFFPPGQSYPIMFLSPDGSGNPLLIFLRCIFVLPLAASRPCHQHHQPDLRCALRRLCRAFEGVERPTAAGRALGPRSPARHVVGTVHQGERPGRGGGKGRKGPKNGRKGYGRCFKYVFV